MNIISCVDCGEFLTEATAPCTRCGSGRKHELIPLLPLLRPGETVGLSIRHRHHIWKYLPKAIQFILDSLPNAPDEDTVKGLCLSTMLDMTSLVEGILTAHLVEELESMLYVEQTDSVLA